MIESGGELTLLDRVEEYLRRHRLKPTRFGKLVVGTPSLVGRMREGKTLRRTTIERIEAQLVSPPRPMSTGEYKAKRYRIAMAANIRAESLDRLRRLSDPHEQAATYLRQRGWRVTRATVHQDDAEGWCVGTARKDDDELLAMARRNGWRG
jgi:hypothetical protein